MKKLCQKKFRWRKIHSDYEENSDGEILKKIQRENISDEENSEKEN